MALQDLHLSGRHLTGQQYWTPQALQHMLRDQRQTWRHLVQFSVTDLDFSGPIMLAFCAAIVAQSFPNLKSWSFSNTCLQDGDIRQLVTAVTQVPVSSFDLRKYFISLLLPMMMMMMVDNTRLPYLPTYRHPLICVRIGPKLPRRQTLSQWSL